MNYNLDVKKLYLCTFILVSLFSFSNLYALEVNLSTNPVEARAYYGTNTSLDGVEKLNRSIQTVTLKINHWKSYFLDFFYSQNAYSEDETEVESGSGIRFGRFWGNKTNQLAIFLGATQQSNYIPVDESGVKTLKQVGFLGKGLGLRLVSGVLSYEYYYESYGEDSINKSTIEGVEFSHKLSLNFGKKLLYGIFYLSKTQDYGTDISYYRHSQGLGAYLGFNF